MLLPDCRLVLLPSPVNVQLNLLPPSFGTTFMFMPPLAVSTDAALVSRVISCTITWFTWLRVDAATLYAELISMPSIMRMPCSEP